MPFYVPEDSSIREKIDGCVKKITVQARTHQTQGRYKDAEYLYRQLGAAFAPLDPLDGSLLKPEMDMVLIYEKLGNLPAAEILQERRLLRLVTCQRYPEDAVISREAENLFRLYTYFLTRIEDLDIIPPPAVPLTVFCRIAVLGCSPLNAVLFKSELWTGCNPDLCLQIAIRLQSTEMIHGLISIGVYINKSAMWPPPLLSAAQYGDLEGLELLLENNVDIRAKSADSETALHCAVLRDPKQRDETYEIICSLIEAGVDVNAVGPSLHTALHSAVFNRPEPEKEVVRCLIESGVDIEAKDDNKDTVLNVAVRKGYLTTAKLLLQLVANTEVGGDKGLTPLFYAVRNGDESMVELLLDHGADIEAQDRSKNSPLHVAVISREIEMVRILLGRGASAAAHNFLAQTPVDIARSDGNRILLDILLGLEN